jgi:hypothetical protein
LCPTKQGFTIAVCTSRKNATANDNKQHANLLPWGKKTAFGSTLPMQILLRNFNPIVRLKINFRGVMGDLKEMGPISVPQGYRFDRLNPLQVLYMT